MATMSYGLLSGSANGRGIKITATASTGTVVHTAVAGTTDVDIVHLYAQNTDTADRKLTIEFGGTTAPDDLIEVTIEGESGLKLVVPGLPLQYGCVVGAFASVGSVISVFGYTHRVDN